MRRPPGIAPAAPARAAAALAALALVALLPLVLSDFRAFQFAYVGIYFIAILGLNVLTGYTGQISIGHGAFMAIGGYTTALLVTEEGVRDLWTIPLGGLAAGVAGLAFGVPALRLSGLYLALATFGIAVSAPAIEKRFEALQAIVLPQPRAPWGIPLSGNDWLYYLTWGVALALLGAAWLLLRGRLGRAFKAIRDSEVAAASSGVNLAAYKTLAFGISAFYAGVAGSLLAIAIAFVNPETFPITLSIALLVGAVVGGLGSLAGLVAGAAFIEFVPVYAQDVSKTAPSVIYGGLLIVLMLVLPTGAAGLLRRLAQALSGRLYTRS